MSGEERVGAGGLPVELCSEAIGGWRANLVQVDADWRSAYLVGIHHRRRYGPEVVAECAIETHRAPHEQCNCGVYAWVDRSRATRYLVETQRDNHVTVALTEVELSGSVIVHGDDAEDEGYRGERVAVMGITFDSRCLCCGQPGELTAVEWTSGEWGVVVCCSEATFDLETAASAAGGRRPLTTSTLAGLLGTEVSVQDLELPPPPRPPWWRRSRLLHHRLGRTMALALIFFVGLQALVLSTTLTPMIPGTGSATAVQSASAIEWLDSGVPAPDDSGLVTALADRGVSAQVGHVTGSSLRAVSWRSEGRCERIGLTGDDHLHVASRSETDDAACTNAYPTGG